MEPTTQYNCHVFPSDCIGNGKPVSCNDGYMHEQYCNFFCLLHPVPSRVIRQLIKIERWNDMKQNTSISRSFGIGKKYQIDFEYEPKRENVNFYLGI